MRACVCLRPEVWNGRLSSKIRVFVGDWLETICSNCFLALLILPVLLLNFVSHCTDSHVDSFSDVTVQFYILT